MAMHIFEELQNATLYPADTNKIGCGSYGSVYSGIVQQIKVAVKFLSQVGSHFWFPTSTILIFHSNFCFIITMQYIH